MGSYIGIDLGTTFSAVATIDDAGRPVIVHNQDGQNVTPSCVQLRGGVVEVGELARRDLFFANSTAVGRFKRDMGTTRTFEVLGDTFTPTHLSTLVLKKLRADAEAELGDVHEAVVTIPANFSHEAREATLQAAQAAGLRVKFIINEPTAAALYYAYKGGNDLHGVYVVYDLGGGTFDVSVIRVDGQEVEVLATNGVAKLGGDDFDAALQQLVGRKYEEQVGDPFDPQDYTKNDAEEDKRSLSRRDQVLARVGRTNIAITRTEFEEAISSFVSQTEMLGEATIDEAGVEHTDVRGVFLVGGSTRIPAVKDSVRRTFGMEPTATANVDEVVALGAAVYAAFKGDRSELSPVQRSAIDQITVSESTGRCFGTISVESSEVRGHERLVNSILIRKGTKIPASVTESYYTVADGQTSVRCRVTESSAPETDPRFVKVVWDGELQVPARPRGQEIQITFAYDENQVMNCHFLDVASGNEVRVDLSVGRERDESGSSAIDRFIVE